MSFVNSGEFSLVARLCQHVLDEKVSELAQALSPQAASCVASSVWFCRAVSRVGAHASGRGMKYDCRWAHLIRASGWVIQADVFQTPSIMRRRKEPATEESAPVNMLDEVRAAADDLFSPQRADVIGGAEAIVFPFYTLIHRTRAGGRRGP